MTQQLTPAGWYPDPTGRHESRYFNGQWTQHVSSRGVNSIDPLPATPAPAVSTSFGAPAYTPYVPAAQSGPNTPPYLQSAPNTRQRSPKIKLAIAGGAVVVAAGITLAILLSSGGSGSNGGHGFCTDAARFGKDIGPARSATEAASEASHLASQSDVLAAESPSPQNAADLRYMARWFRLAAGGNHAAAEADKAHYLAVGRRVVTYVDEKCPSLRHP